MSETCLWLPGPGKLTGSDSRFLQSHASCDTPLLTSPHLPGTLPLVLTTRSGDSEVVTSKDDSEPEQAESLPRVQVLSLSIWPQRTWHGTWSEAMGGDNHIRPEITHLLPGFSQ